MNKTLLITCTVLMATPVAAVAQPLTGTENGEWRYLGGDAGHTRYSPLDQINAGNFEDLEVEWIWRSDNFGPNVDYFSRSTPIYVDGMLYTVATPRRQGGAIDQPRGRRSGLFASPRPLGVCVLQDRPTEKGSPTLRWTVVA